MSEYSWRAIYEDGTFLDEYKEDKTPNSYWDIDRTRLIIFELFKNGKSIYRLHLEPEQTLIYRRRVRADPGGNVLYVFYMVGWQQKIKGQNVQSIAYIQDDDESPISSAGRWEGGMPEPTKEESNSLNDKQLF